MSDEQSKDKNAVQIMLDAKKKSMGGKPVVKPAVQGVPSMSPAMSMGERMRQIAGKK